MLTSLTNAYAKLKKIAKSLNLDNSVPLPLQDSSLIKQSKRKTMELEPKTYIVGLHCNKVLPKGVKFKENRVIEELEFGLIYKMMALPDKSPTNKMFVELMDKNIEERPNKHILLTNQAKLELIGIKLEE
ncbi:hypothetical protein Tco_0227018 [Tanacetum coccineum]